MIFFGKRIFFTYFCICGKKDKSKIYAYESNSYGHGSDVYAMDDQLFFLSRTTDKQGYYGCNG
jgi:hypothetical protein